MYLNNPKNQYLPNSNLNQEECKVKEEKDEVSKSHSNEASNDGRCVLKVLEACLPVREIWGVYLGYDEDGNQEGGMQVNC